MDGFLIRIVILQRPYLIPSFDWNGAREPYILATENDVLNGLGYVIHEAFNEPAADFCRCTDLLESKGCKGGCRIYTGGKSKGSERFYSSD